MGIVTFEAPKVLPIIRQTDVSRTLKCVEQVLSAGADGVFLDNPASHSAASLHTRHDAVRIEFPDTPIGLNFRDMRDPIEVYRYLYLSGVMPDAVWTDWYSLNPNCIELFQAITNDYGMTEVGLFASVAHAGPHYESDPLVCAEIASAVDRIADFIATTGARALVQPQQLRK